MTKHHLTDESIILIHGAVRESPLKPKTLRLLVLLIELCLFDQMEHGNLQLTNQTADSNKFKLFLDKLNEWIITNESFQKQEVLIVQDNWSIH